VTTGVIVRGDLVVLRPYRLEEVDAMEAAMSTAEARAWLPLGAPPRQELRRRVGAAGELSEGRIDLAIEADGRLAGEIDGRHPRWAVPPGVWEIGISMFDSADRGRGYGREAVTLLCDRLFQREGAHRVALTTDLDNAPMRAVAERCGFRFEGVLRSFMPSAGGGRRDYAMYAITKDDWRALRAGDGADRIETESNTDDHH
jgi:RimJ/RimL family protein N-acetyltransferase